MASISLRKLVKRYGTGAAAVQVINGIDAEVSDGEFVVIVGPSGRRAAASPRCCAWWPGWKKSPAASCALASAW